MRIFLKISIIIIAVFSVQSLKAQIDVTGSTGANGTYSTLTAAFTAINASSQTGQSPVITVTGNTVESFPGAILNAGTWTLLTIQPAPGAQKSILGNISAAAVIDLNGADNVHIIGYNSAGTGNLIIKNLNSTSSSGTSVIRFRADACFNKINSCNIYSRAGLNGGTGGVYFWTGSVRGNDSNEVSNCNIGSDSAVTTQCIVSNGTLGVRANSNNVITDCNLFNFFSATSHSSGIYIANGTNDMIITKNNFYQTAPRTFTSTGLQHSAISITFFANNITITENVIGYSDSTATGTYTIIGNANSRIIPISMTVDSLAVSKVSKNIINNFSITGSTNGSATGAPFIGILARGTILIDSNIIGSMTDTSAISLSTTSASVAEAYGIYLYGNNSMTCNNNQIGGITISNSGLSHSNLTGVNAQMNPGDSLTFNGNIIGGTTAKSMNNKSTLTNTRMIGFQSGNFYSTINNNVIRNLYAAGGSGTLSGSSISGMNIFGSAFYQNVTGNRIYNLQNTNPSTVSVVNGIFFSNANAPGIVSENFVSNLVISGSASTVNGFNVNGAQATFQNNMISLGFDENGNSINHGGTFNGILDAGTDNYYFNSVYIGGSATTGSGNSYVFNNVNTFATRNFRNNIFCNERSNTGSTGTHYAVRLGGSGINPPGLTMNNNVLYSGGAGASIGFYNNIDRINLAAWQEATGMDLNSYESDPHYLNSGGNPSLVDLHIDPLLPVLVESNGFNIPSVTLDYDGQTRSIYSPVDIGADAGNFTTSKIFNLGIFIQGFYNSVSNTMISDTVGVYLRNDSPPYSVIDSGKIYLSNLGLGTCLFPNAVDSVPYYIQITHRNAVETWSNVPKIFVASSLTHNFKTSLSQAYGSNQIQVDATPVNYAIYNGDVNHDGVVDATDLSLIDNDASAFVTGYVSTDLTGDDVVDASDASIADNNAGNFVGKVIP